MTAASLFPEDTDSASRVDQMDSRRQGRAARSHARSGPETPRSPVPHSGVAVPRADDLGIPPAVEQACSLALQRLNGGTAASIAVTSALRGEGRTTLALGTAMAQMHEHERRTVLLELDVATPTLAGRLQVPARPGLSELLAGDVDLESCLHWPLPNLALLPAGAASLEPARLLARFARSGVVGRLEDAGYCVVADLPPLPPTGPGDRVVDLFSGVLLVVRAGKTPASAVRAAAGALAEPPAVVLNGRESAVPRWLRRTLGG